MEIKKSSKSELKDILGGKKLDNSGNVFVYDGKKYAFDTDFLSDFKKYGEAMLYHYGVSRWQIGWLDAVKGSLKNPIYLPSGVLSFHDADIAAIYNNYYLGYNTFKNLSEEETELIIGNLRKAIEYNRELMEQGVYNVDLTFRKLLYLGSKVGLIGLDGKYIKQAKDAKVRDVYAYFAVEFKKLIEEKLKLQCMDNDREYTVLKRELDNIMSQNRDMDSFYYPDQIINDVEMVRILK